MNEKKTEKITLSLHKKTIRRIRKYAEEENRTLSAIVDLAIDHYGPMNDKIRKFR